MLSTRQTTIIALIFALFSLFVTPHAWAMPDGLIGQVTRSEGAVTLTRDGTERPIATGTSIHVGDRIETGADGRLTIDFIDGATLSIGPATQVEIAAYPPLETGAGRVIAVLAGIVRAVIGDDAVSRGFDIVTPTAIAAARGTTWIVDVDPQATGVFVAEGVVAVSARTPEVDMTPRTVLLEAGEGTDVRAGAGPTAPRQWGQARIDKAYARLGLPAPQ